MPRVLALALDDDTRRLLDARADEWGVTVEHEDIPEALRSLRRDGAVSLVVVGGVGDPVRAVQRTQMVSPGLPVLVLAAHDECSDLAHALRYTPFVSGDVRCVSVLDVRLADELGLAIDIARRRRQHEKAIDRLNQQLSGERIAPSAAAGVLGSLLEVAPIGVVLLSEGGAIRAINPRGLEVLGAVDQGILGRRLHDQLPPDEQARLQDLLDAMQADSEARPSQVLSAGPRGETTLQATGSRLTESAGGPGYLIVLQDVTERQALIEELRDAHRRKDEFLAMLGHELRNPLAPIRTAVELMRLRGDTTSERERGVIERQVEHLVELVDDLLDVSRITRGALELSREPLELADAVAGGIEQASPLIEQRRHTLDVQVPRRGLEICGDRRRLAQIVANLLTNAAKYMHPGGTISVTGRREADAVWLAVRDSGAGIDPELLPRLFDVFVQARRGIERREGGLGIGLTIVRSLVELHGGAVEVASEPGAGTEFRVRLPALEGERGERATPPPGPEETSGARHRVLVVDDNTDAAELLAELVESAGYATDIARDGPTALERAAAHPPDVALLDIGLPVMSGYELAARLRQLPGLDRIGLVAVTGYGGELDRERSREAGFQYHLVKPIAPDALFAAVAELTGRGP